MKTIVVAIFVLITATILPAQHKAVSTGFAYYGQKGYRQHPSQFPRPFLDRQPDELSDIEKENVRKAGEQRFAALKRDTDRLVQLAAELKRNVDRSNENVLSVDVIKKAEQIERLAKSVKQKMKGN